MPSTENQNHGQTKRNYATDTEPLTSGKWAILWVIVSASLWIGVSTVYWLLLA